MQGLPTGVTELATEGTHHGSRSQRLRVFR